MLKTSKQEAGAQEDGGCVCLHCVGLMKAELMKGGDNISYLHPPVTGPLSESKDLTQPNTTVSLYSSVQP